LAWSVHAAEVASVERGGRRVSRRSESTARIRFRRLWVFSRRPPPRRSRPATGPETCAWYRFFVESDGPELRIRKRPCAVDRVPWSTLPGAAGRRDAGLRGAPVVFPVTTASCAVLHLDGGDAAATWSPLMTVFRPPSTSTPIFALPSASLYSRSCRCLARSSPRGIGAGGPAAVRVRKTRPPRCAVRCRLNKVSPGRRAHDEPVHALRTAARDTAGVLEYRCTFRPSSWFVTRKIATEM